jgi:glutathione synthase
MAPVEVQNNSGSFQVATGESFLAPLNKMDLILWRKQAPYLMDDWFILDALQMAAKETKVLNSPKSLRGINETLYSLQFEGLIPPTLVTKSSKAVQGFISEAGGKAVLRSLQPAQAKQSFFLRMGDPNLATLAEATTHQNTQCCIIQKLVTEPGLDGDKRIFMLDGSFLDIALQIPAIGELRGTFERGAEAATTQPTDKDLKVAQVVGQQLKEDGIFFATIDVSDGLIVDINLTCPSGLPQLQSISGEDYASMIIRRALI